MQIGSSNLLTFLPGNTPQAAAQAKDQDADNTLAAASNNGAPLSGIAPEPETAGVILSLQSEAAAAGAALPKDLVYSNARKGASGVLMALPVSAAEVKSQAFMHHAVTAMRAYADEQERTKTANPSADNAPGAALIPRSLADVHKLAARLKLFA